MEIATFREIRMGIYSLNDRFNAVDVVFCCIKSCIFRYYLVDTVTSNSNAEEGERKGGGSGHIGLTLRRSHQKIICEKHINKYQCSKMKMFIF